MQPTKRRLYAGAIVAMACMTASAHAGDWPAWRHDAMRSAVTDETLPRTLHLQWKRDLPPLQPAWPDQDRLRFDVAYEPIVVGKTLFIASPVRDSVTAYDTDTGREKWRFYTNGPVRFAPTAWQDKLYFVSDDGHLYCVNQSDGKLVWKFRGAPTDRLVLGNNRLISMWPARGAPVIVDDKVYFTAGIWPVMGVFIYALDAETGEMLWHNDALGPMWIKQPHRSPAFAGIGPQGYLATLGDRLFIPGGRSVPACLDRATGKLRYYHLAENQHVGGFAVTVSDRFLYNSGRLFDVTTGIGGIILHPWQWRVFGERPRPVLVGDTLYGVTEDDEDRRRVRAFKIALEEMIDRKGQTYIAPGVTEQWHVDAGTRVHLVAGSRLYTSSDNTVYAVDLPTADAPVTVSWQTPIDSVVESMIAADGKLFVSTREGRVLCYSGDARSKPAEHGIWIDVTATAPAKTARDVFDASGVRHGYCLAFGLKDGQLIEQLAANSELKVIGIDPDAKKVNGIRRRLDNDHFYGERISLIVADPRKLTLPPYLASLVVSEDMKAGGYPSVKFMRQVAHVLRPYGAVACFPRRPVGVRLSARLAARAGLKDIELDVDYERDLIRMRRPGPLEGSAAWTHQYGDPANSVVSKDALVKPPLGVLWFGGSTHFDVLPRHGHGPAEHVIGGRLFIEGPDSLRAMDVYTGRVLWQRELPGIGQAYNQTYHQPGANAVGSNYASAGDGIYVIQGDNCLRLHPATGKTMSTFHVPTRPGVETHAPFGFVSVVGDLLVTGVSPMSLDWDPLFRTGQFYNVRRKKKMPLMYEIVSAWKGGPSIARDACENGLDYLVRNFNAILNEESLVDKVPRTVLAERGDLPEVVEVREIIAAYLKARGPSDKYDTTLRALNRVLISMIYPDVPKTRRGAPGYFNWDATSSREIVVMNRHSGKVLWRRPARHAFRHNTIISGGNKVYAIDRLPGPVLDILQRRGESPPDNGSIVAFDLNTGDAAWSVDDGVFGTWLGYSEEHDVLVQSGRGSRDMLYGEPTETMSAYRAGDGTPLWDQAHKHYGPVMLHGRKMISSGGDAYDLLTGGEAKWENPLTGRREEWRYRRMYGCNSPVASKHLLTFRSAAAGFYDLTGMGGTSNLGGFKSGCTSNLIAADGVLNAPDYTRTCTCSYQNQASLAFVHMPEVEMWAFNTMKPIRCDRIRRLGLNLGAPGDRRTPDGTLWLEYPVVGGPSPRLDVTMAPEKIDTFYQHSLRMQANGLKWVTASGAKGIRRLTVTLAKPVQFGGCVFTTSFPERYTVRLHFSEPDGAKPGERVFDVALQGKTVLDDFDVVAVAGAPDRGVVRTFPGITVDTTLVLTLTPSEHATRTDPLLSGVEIVADDW